MLLFNIADMLATAFVTAISIHLMLLFNRTPAQLNSRRVGISIHLMLLFNQGRTDQKTQ